MRASPRFLRWLLGAAVLATAAWLLWRQLQGMDLAQVRTALAALTPAAVIGCLAATTLSFLCLAAYERLATQWFAPGRVPRAVAWRTGLVAHALANTLGFHPVTAMALRLDRYRAHGVDATTLAKIVAAIGACVAMGVLAILAVAAAWAMWSLGTTARWALIALLVLASLVLRRVRVFPQAASVLALGLLEMTGALLAFAVLLPWNALPQGPALVLLFVTATALGVVSHSPGGLGVFEATMLAATAPAMRAPMLASLLAYRLLYNLLPCALALLALTAANLHGRFSSTAGTRA